MIYVDVFGRELSPGSFTRRNFAHGAMNSVWSCKVSDVSVQEVGMVDFLLGAEKFLRFHVVS